MEHVIINHSHSKNFTVIPNELLQSGEIPPFSLGVLVYLLSLPTIWNTSAAKIAGHFGEKEVRVLRALKDLIELGYCKRVPYREDGKLRGQKYFITDIRNDFSDPTIFGGTAEAEGQKSQTSEISDPQKNGGSEIKDISIERKNISGSEKKHTNTCESTDECLCLFEKSKFNDFNKFCQHFAGDDYAGVDLRHYFEAVKNWSASKRVKRNDWIATARSFMHRDHERGGVVRVRQQGGDVLSDAAKRYLQLGNEIDLWPEL